MIAARLEPTIPPVRGTGPRLEQNEDARSGGFEEALAEQEHVAAKDVPAIPAEQACCPPPPPSAPAALQALVAQLLGPHRAMPVREESRDATSQSETPAQAPLLVPAKAQAHNSSAHAANASPAAALNALPDEAMPLVASEGAEGHTGEPARERPPSDLDETSGDMRDVTIRSVSSSSHFAIGLDPVRQIANEVTRALGGTGPTQPTIASPPDHSQPVKTLHLQLEPEALGTVTVRMKLAGGQLSLRIDVVEPATLDMIRQEQDRLQKSLGPELERLEIRAAGAESPAAVSAPESSARASSDMGRGADASRAQGEQAAGHGRARDERGRQEQEKRQGHDATEPHRERRDSLRGLYL